MGVLSGPQLEHGARLRLTLQTYATPIFLNVVRQLTPSAAGARLAPRAIPGIVAGLIAGLVTKSYGRVKIIALFGCTLQVIGALLNTRWSATIAEWVFIICRQTWQS